MLGVNINKPEALLGCPKQPKITATNTDTVAKQKFCHSERKLSNECELVTLSLPARPPFTTLQSQ